MVKWLNSFLFCMLVTLCSVTSAQNKIIDSLINVLKIAKEDTAKIGVLNLLIVQNIKIDQYDKAINLVELIKRYSENLNYIKGLILYHHHSGEIYRLRGNYVKSLEHHLKALKLEEEVGDENGRAASLNDIGIIYMQQGNYSKALEHYLKMLAITNKLKNKKGIATSLANIGMIYNYHGDYPKALEYYFKSLKIMEDLSYKLGIADLHGNIGGNYYDQLNYQNALKHYTTALTSMRELNNKSGIAALILNIGNIYSDQNNYQKAIENYFEALKLQEEIGDRSGIALSAVNIGEVFTQLKKYEDAKKYLNKAFMVSKAIGSKGLIKESYLGLSILDSVRGNGMAAYLNYKNYIIYRDSLINEENSKKIIRAEMNFEFEKKEHETKVEQEKKDAVNSKEKQKQAVVRNSLIIGFVLVIILALVIYRSYVQKQKANTQLEEKNNLIAEQKHLVEEKHKEITASIRYAKRIQTALITSEKYIAKNLNKLNG